MGIKLLPPDINESEGLFLPENGGIRYGLICIKNVGRAAVDGVVKERKQNGKFTDFSDFVRRVPMDALNKRMIESLIMGGAFDCFGKNRATLMGNYEFIMDVEMKSKDLLHQLGQREFGGQSAKARRITCVHDIFGQCTAPATKNRQVTGCLVKDFADG